MAIIPDLNNRFLLIACPLCFTYFHGEIAFKNSERTFSSGGHISKLSLKQALEQPLKIVLVIYQLLLLQQPKRCVLSKIECSKCSLHQNPLSKNNWCSIRSAKFITGLESI